jgi:murein L,D-transpeptidase YafK
MLVIKPTFLLALFAVAAILGLSATAIADGKLPASLIRMPESVQTLFIAETSTAQFHRFDNSSDGAVHNGSYYMSIGQNGPGKERSGDRRTPLGVYFVTEQLDTSRFHEKYGATAFPLDYPNAWDRRAGRDGDGIWVHGVARNGGQRPPWDTDGCIAVPNEQLMLLVPDFRNNITPVVVTREVDWVDVEQIGALRTELESHVAEWANSKSQADLHAFLSLYSSEFKHWGMNKAEWSSLTAQTEKLRLGQRVDFSDLLLLGYPEEEGLYLSRFLIEVVEDEGKITRSKRLYWRRDSSGALKIVAEDDG